MSSLKRASKSVQRLHKERGQLIGRQGYLEKKKDYKLRSRDYQKKKNAIIALERRALNRNPDEFYFKMVKTVKKDGVHQERESDEPAYTDDQIKLMRSQDIQYIKFKRSTELKKIENLKSELHLLDAVDKPRNKHIIFVDTKKQAREFDVAIHFDTHPQFVDRAYNRPHLSTLATTDLSSLTDHTLQQISSEQTKRYKELDKRIAREKELRVVEEKMTIHNQIMNKRTKKEKICDETRTSAAQYKWAQVRKR